MSHGPLLDSYSSISLDGDIFPIGQSITVSREANCCGVSIVLMHCEDVLSAALDAGIAIGVILVYFWFVEFWFAFNFLLTGGV